LARHSLILVLFIHSFVPASGVGLEIIMIRVALFVLVLIAFVLGFLYFQAINPGDITVHLSDGLNITLPISVMLISVMLIGLLIGTGIHMLSAMLVSLRSWRGGRLQKKSEEISNMYRSGVGRLLSGDLVKARALLTKAYDRDNKRVDTLLALASVALQEGKQDEGIELLQKARKLEPKGYEVLFKLAATYEQSGRREEAMGIYKELLASDTNNRKAMRSQRDILIDLKQWEEALALQKRLVKASPSGAKGEAEKSIMRQLRYELIVQQLDAGQIDQAIDGCRELIKQNAACTPARVTLGDAYHRAGRDSDAIKVYQDGYRALKKSVFLARLEDLCINVENPAALLSFYRKQMQTEPDDLLLKLYFGRLCLRLEMVDEAFQHLGDLESSNVEFSKLHLLLAEAQRRRNNTQEAVKEYQKALNIDGHLSLGYFCENCGAKSAEWQSRCPECNSWDSLVLPERQLVQNVKLNKPQMIPHGARS
jgi:lipopolysaccharide biosynthesis regulator YciM